MSGLVFHEKGHRYTLDGQKIPGVTTLIGDGVPKKALPYWAAKTVAEFVAANPETVEGMRRMGRGPMVAALKEVPWQQRDDKAERGTVLHDYAERLQAGEDVEVPPHLVSTVQGLARLLDQFDVQTLHAERPVYSRKWWYAGTADSISVVPRLGGVTLLDWKSSNNVYGDTILQTAAYATADKLVQPDESELDIESLGIQALAVVHVTEHESFLHPLARDVETIERAAAIFRHVAFVAKSLPWVKAQLGDYLVPDGA